MRLLCRFLPLVFLVIVASSAWATRIIIQDPDDPFTVTPVTTSQFVVTFSNDCASALSSSAPGAGSDGCFAFKNLTGYDWSSITLTTGDSPTNGAFTCAAPGLYSTVSCNGEPGSYVLTFSDGAVPDQTAQRSLSYYVISEDDLPPGDLTFNATVTFATTPEPSGVMLLGTGLLCAGVMMWTRRRVLA